MMRYLGGEIKARQVLADAWNDLLNNHAMTMAAGLAYFFVLSLFPLCILAATLVAFLPIPNLFDALLATMAHVVPPEGMGVVAALAATAMQPHGGLLTVGILGTLWAASSGFATLTEALNVAYDATETRPYWKVRLVALGLMLAIGALFVGTLGLTLLGPIVANWLWHTYGIDVGWLQSLSPILKWLLSLGATIMGVELLLFWAPNVKQEFWATFPGAVIGVGFFIGSSYALSIYFRHFADYNKTYGALGGAMALLVWLYYSWFAILVGAELNAELLKASGRGTLDLKQKPSK